MEEYRIDTFSGLGVDRELSRRRRSVMPTTRILKQESSAVGKGFMAIHDPLQGRGYLSLSLSHST